MICDKCGSVNVVSKIVIEGDKDPGELNLCPSCFRNFVKEHPGFGGDTPGNPLADILLGTINFLNNSLKTHTKRIFGNEAGVRQCPGCFIPESAVKSEGLTGCPKCYVFFKKEIDDYLFCKLGTNVLLEDEKKPSAKAQKAEALKIRLDAAVKSENFELAAAIRDEIKQLK